MSYSNYDFVGMIDGLKYNPWIGSEFAGQDLRLFFVGNSHYGDDLQEVDAGGAGLTREVVERAISTGGLRFFTGLMQATCGMSQTYVDWKKFYDRIAFSNLLQYALVESRTSAPHSDLKLAVPLLESVFQEVSPTHIILLGDGVWNAFEDEGKLDGYVKTDISYHLKGQSWNYVYMRHPSAAFSSTDWSNKLSAGLAETGVSRETLDKFVESVRYHQKSALLGGYDNWSGKGSGSDG